MVERYGPINVLSCITVLSPKITTNLSFPTKLLVRGKNIEERANVKGKVAIGKNVILSDGFFNEFIT